MATQVQEQMACGGSVVGSETPAQISAASSSRDDRPEPIASKVLTPEHKGYADLAKSSCFKCCTLSDQSCLKMLSMC